MQFIPADQDAHADALVLANSDDVLSRAEDIARHRAVALQFPKWTDGRAYSQAVLLRGRLRYAGDIRATGQVLADMLPLLRRCGFNAVQLRADQKLEAAQRALGYFGNHNQTVPAERVEPKP
ncbi:MAG: DUF934 domain-containing protein [Rubrivivax sp.]|nr:DUF934 domain-containing protein [Rubrivivax sp.]